MKKIFAANWKMYKTPNEARSFFSEWQKSHFKFNSNNSEVFFFPTALSAESVSQSISGLNLNWGVQNAYFEKEGAFTGELSMNHAKEMGAAAVLVGHSERRTLFGETNSMLAKKNSWAQQTGVTPFYCIGETLEERNQEATLKVLDRQLREGLVLAKSEDALVVAYEPVWAIGTGKVAEAPQIKEAHLYIRSVLDSLGFTQSQILYGGSVKPETAAELIQIPHVDGFLVGGASLKVDSFQKIIGSI